MSVPCSITLESMSDLLKLEKLIRELLHCQASNCSFLQSADYMALKFAITRNIQKRQMQPSSLLPSSTNESLDTEFGSSVLHIPQSALTLFVSDNLSTIVIKSRNTVYIESKKEEKKKPKGAASMNTMAAAATVSKGEEDEATDQDDEAYHCDSGDEPQCSTGNSKKRKRSLHSQHQQQQQQQQQQQAYNLRQMAHPSHDHSLSVLDTKESQLLANLRNLRDNKVVNCNDCQ